MKVMWKNSHWLSLILKPINLSNLILILGLIYFVPWQLNYAWRVIQTPYPIEYREGSTLLLTDFLLQGQNPFSLENQPLMNNNYGLLYNLFVLPFAYFWGNTFLVHRSLSLVFILLSCCLMTLVLLKNEVTLPMALTGSSLLLGSMLYGAHAGARSEGLGQLLFLIAILIPWYRKFDWISLSISGLVGVFAFFAKPYYLLSVGIVASYLFLFISKSKGLIFLGASVGLLIFISYLVNSWFECYFLDVVINNMFNSLLSFKYMWYQLLMFVIAFSPSIVVMLSRGVWLLKSTAPLFIFRRGFNLFELQHPLWQISFDYFGYFFGCSLLAVGLLLGRHMGTYLTYFYQLLTPGLVLIVFRKFDLRQNIVFNSVLFLINLGVICFGILLPNQLSSSEQQNWEKLPQRVEASQRILNSPLLVADMVRFGKLPVDSGQTEYFYTTHPYPDTYWVPPYSEIDRKRKQYLDEISNSIQYRNYDRIIITQDHAPLVDLNLLHENYKLVDVFPLNLPQTDQSWMIEVWEPKE